MIFYNLDYNELYKHAKCLYKTTKNGAILAYSGEYTGRCPNDKRIVFFDQLKNICWDINKPINDILFYYYYIQAHNYLNEIDNVYVVDSYAGWDKNNQISVRTYCTDPYHAIFMKNMLIPSEKTHSGNIDLEIVNCGDVKLTKYDQDLKNLNIDKDNLNENLISLDLIKGKVLIFGTNYAGEMKKAVLTYMMYKMPIQKKLTLHSSMCLDKNNNVIAFFGLSGTGKTTLSSTEGLKLIGDDEHVWTDDGVFNIEGGCYAKCKGLSKKNEPEIYNAIKKNAILENVKLDKNGDINFNDNSITDNTRCSYPLHNLENILLPATINKHPKNIILLVCDGFGLFPIVSKLTKNQAIFYFLLGYTCKMPGTEKNILEPTKTYSACFAEPFIIWKPEEYGNLLREKIEKNNSNVWLLNTGWTKDGQRIPLEFSRKIVNIICENNFEGYSFNNYENFNFQVPNNIESIPNKFNNPYYFWQDYEEYQINLKNFLWDIKNNFIKKCGNDLFNKLNQP